jgi:hypothetical protein
VGGRFSLAKKGKSSRENPTAFHGPGKLNFLEIKE